MLKIFLKIFCFKTVKHKHKEGNVGKPKKGKAVIVNTWKHRW